jgi:membrane associated rhomboid family serine protease
MSNITKDTVREIRDFWRQHTFKIKQEFKNNWEKYLLYRLASTAVIITSVIALIAFFIWLVYNHAMIAAIVIWSMIGLFVGGAVFSIVYREIDKAVKR